MTRESTGKGHVSLVKGIDTGQKSFPSVKVIYTFQKNFLSVFRKSSQTSLFLGEGSVPSCTIFESIIDENTKFCLFTKSNGWMLFINIHIPINQDIIGSL